MIKRLLAIAVLFAGILVSADEQAKEDVKFEQGARVDLYLRPPVVGSPLEIGIDKSNSFSEDNVKDLPSFNSHYNYRRWMNWRGFLNIPRDGTYCFSASIDMTDGEKSKTVYVTLKKDEQKTKPIIHVGVNLKYKGEFLPNDATERMDLKAGMVLLDIDMLLWENNWGANPFSLKFWDVSRPMERKTITPSMLLYPEGGYLPVLME